MKKFNLIIFNFFLVCTGLGQTYNPLIRPNIYWEVMNGDGRELCNYNGGNRYSFQGDTIISGKSYKLIMANPIVSQTVSPPYPPGAYCPPFAVNLKDTLDKFNGYYSKLLREDSIAKKVFVYETNYGDTLLYDFNLTDGDTFISASDFSGPYTLIVDSVRSITLLNGAVRKIFYLSNKEYYIEGIGGSEGLQFHLFNPAAGFGYWHEPICFVENNIPLWGTQCLGTVGIDEIKDKDLIAVFPNPAANFLQIERINNLGATFVVMDLTGRIVLTKKLYYNKERIDISILSSGSYIYNVVNEKQTVIGKFIVTK